MKKEPLKGKKNQIAGVFIFYPKDIKSAVEWLKENIQIEQEGEFVIKVKDVNKLIDEAFEDVMEKKQ